MIARALLCLTGLVLGTAISRPAEALTLIYSNDVHGEIEPCGCRGNPTGGMVRKSVFLERLKENELLQLDAGDLLFDSTSIAHGLEAQSRLQAATLLRAMKDLGHDAVVPGEKDLALGVDVFLKLIKKGGIPFLAANLLRKKSGKPLLDGFKIFEKKAKTGKKIRIAVLALVGDDLPWPKELKVAPALQTAKTWVPKLKKKADLVIALTHQGIEADRKLAKDVPGIDLIVGAHTQSFLETPELVNGTRIVQTSFRNQVIGVMPIELPFTAKGHRMVSLDESFEPSKNSGNAMQKLVADFKAQVAELNSKLTLRKVSQEQVKLQSFPRCTECHWQQFDFWRKTDHAKALTPLIEAKQFMNRECLGCHSLGLGVDGAFMDLNVPAKTRKEGLSFPELHDFLSEMHEAESLDDQVRLTRKGDQLPLRDAVSKLDRSWVPVQCENCHGAGGDHPFGQPAGTRFTVKTETCLQCHTSVRAPSWYKNGKPDLKLIEKKRQLIACPAN